MTTRDLAWFAGGALSASLVGWFLSNRTPAPPVAALPARVAAPLAVSPGLPAMPGASAGAPATTPGKVGTFQVPTVADSTARLATRLARDGGSAADWKLLGQSYDFLGRKDEAKAAYAHALTAAAAAPPAGTAPPK